MSDVLTKHELADVLRFTVRQVDSLCESRTRAKQKPEERLPLFKINGNVRFSRQAVDQWLARLQDRAA